MWNKVQQIPGGRLVLHAAIVVVAWLLVTGVLGAVDDLMNYYIALVAMYSIAMFGMVILVGLSGQVSLGNGALMAIGGYVFALTSLNWETVPFLGLPWNAVWSMVFAGLGGVLIGLLLGGIAARLRGPYLAGLTLGVAVGIPAIANRFPSVFGGENGLIITVPYPEGGYGGTGVVSYEDELAAQAEFADQEFEELPEEFVQDQPVEDLGADELLTDESFPDEALAEGDLLTDESFPDEALTEDEFLTDESFPDEAVAEEDVLTADSFPDEAAVDEVPLEEEFVDESLGIDEALGGLDADFIIERWQASMALLVACIVGFIALNLIRGRQGRVWQAVRDDPIAAAVSGIFPAGSKVSAFVVSSLFAALSGAVFAQILSYVGPGAFGLGLSLSLLVGIVLGGRASLIGAILGAIILVWLPIFVLDISEGRGWGDQITNNAPNLIYGLLVVLVVLLVPGGIVGSLSAGFRKVFRRSGSV
jgi:ABC-type branched-subunit amino acid transport system permease subunit